MALAERADLVARLSLDGNFVQQTGRAQRALRGMETSFKKIGGLASTGLKNAATNTARIGIVAGGVVADQVRRGLSSLAELEDAVTAVDGAIDQVGKGWSTTGQQVAQWANEIETSVQRAFDDKEITQATENLIRYGGVTEKNIRPAMEVMTDLAAKTGDVGGASTILAKALAAPEKAAGKLTRMGIVLTEQQQKQIEKLVAGGKAAEAQGLLLDILAEKTKDAAAASKGPYNDAMNILKDVTEDAQRVLAQGFLPLLSRVADELSTFIEKPENMQQVKEFGETLAGAFDDMLGIAKNIPWGLIGDSLKTAGKGAKAIFDAFTMLPPWVQQAVITGWGLNKLTGGALGSIVGELGKGLVKGVLGMTAGIVNIKAGTVVGGGGSGVPGAGKGGGALNALALAGFAVSLGAVVGTVISDIWTEIGPQPISRDANGNVATQNKGVVDRSPVPFDGKVGRTLRVYGQVEDRKGAIKWDRIARNTDTGNTKISAVTQSVRDAKAAQLSGLDKLGSKTATVAANVMSAKAAQIAAADRSRTAITATTRAGDAAVVRAIGRIQRPIVSVSVVGNTVRTVYRTGGTVTRNVSKGNINAGLYD